MGEGVRGWMGTGRSRVEFEACGVGRVTLQCAWHVFGVWATQGLMGEAWKRVVWSFKKCMDLKAQPWKTVVCNGGMMVVVRDHHTHSRKPYDGHRLGSYDHHALHMRYTRKHMYDATYPTTTAIYVFDYLAY